MGVGYYGNKSRTAHVVVPAREKVDGSRIPARCQGRWGCLGGCPQSSKSHTNTLHTVILSMRLDHPQYRQDTTRVRCITYASFILMCVCRTSRQKEADQTLPCVLLAPRKISSL